MKVMIAFLANSVTNFVIGILVATYLGPGEYGRFAIAFAIVGVVQTALFDWLRLAATRFYSEKVREYQPVVRASLDLSFVAVTGGLILSTLLYALIGPKLDFDSTLILLALAAAAVNGLFDYSIALVRARFEDQLFWRLVLGKNFLSLVLTGGGAFFFRSASVAMGGVIVSLLGTVIAARASLTDRHAQPRFARRNMAATLAAYSAPIVAAHLIYQAVPLATRSVVADVFDFAEAGQFALAFDLGMRAIQALGSALDVLLFQIAVAAHENHGDDEARWQVGRNMAVVLAVLLPGCVGVYLVMPSIELLDSARPVSRALRALSRSAAPRPFLDGDDTLRGQSRVPDRQEDRADDRGRFRRRAGRRAPSLPSALGRRRLQSRAGPMRRLCRRTACDARPRRA